MVVGNVFKHSHSLGIVFLGFWALQLHWPASDASAAVLRSEIAERRSTLSIPEKKGLEP